MPLPKASTARAGGLGDAEKTAGTQLVTLNRALQSANEVAQEEARRQAAQLAARGGCVHAPASGLGAACMHPA